MLMTCALASSISVVRRGIVGVGHDAAIRVVHEDHALQAVVAHPLLIVLAVDYADEVVEQIVGVARGIGDRRAGLLVDLIDTDEAVEAVLVLEVWSIEVCGERIGVLLVKEGGFEREVIGAGGFARATVVSGGLMVVMARPAAS